MSDQYNQNTSTGDGIQDSQSSRDSSTDGESGDGSATSDRPIKATESLKSLIAPSKSLPKPNSSPEPSEATDAVQPKIFPVISKISSKPASADSQTNTGAVQETVQAAVSETQQNEIAESIRPQPEPNPSPLQPQPSLGPSNDIDDSGLFSWSSGRAKDFIEDDEDEEIQELSIEQEIVQPPPTEADFGHFIPKESDDGLLIDANRSPAASILPESSDDGFAEAQLQSEAPAMETRNSVELKSADSDAQQHQPQPPQQNQQPEPQQFQESNQPQFSATTEFEPLDNQVQTRSTNTMETLDAVSISTPEQSTQQEDFDASAISDEEFFDELIEKSGGQPTTQVNAPQNELSNPPPSSSPVYAPAQASALTQNTQSLTGAESLTRPRETNDPYANRKYALVGQTLFDRYVVLDVIGEGETCLVYTAMNLNSESEAIVAVKTPRVVTPAFKESFLQAVIKHGKLKHPHIIRSIEYLESPDGQPFYIMENQQGVTLDEILQSVEKLDDEDSIALILTQTASALEYANGLGIAHGRLSPHNILLIDDNEQLQVKVADFQIATLASTTDDTKSKGKSTAYMSPETRRGAPVTEQGDVYSLGAIAYRMVTGRFPYDGQLKENTERTPDPLAKYGPDLKRVHQLNQILQEALESEASWRIDTISGFKESIQEWIDAVHQEIASEPYLSTSEMDVPSFETTTVDSNFAPTSAYQQVESYDSAAPTMISAPDQAYSPPPAVPLDELGELVLKAETPKRRRRSAEKRTGQQNIRTTIHKLVALKKKQFDQDQTVAMKFTEKIAAEGPRRSPLATMVRIVAVIVLCGGCTIGCVTYILTNQEQVRQIWTGASRQLSMLLPGKGPPPEEIKEGPKIVFEKPVGKPEKPKLKPSEIHATPPRWAVTKEAGAVMPSRNNPSFGVTNNWSGDPKSNRVRIEYRDYEDVK